MGSDRIGRGGNTTAALGSAALYIPVEGGESRDRMTPDPRNSVRDGYGPSFTGSTASRYSVEANSPTMSSTTM